MLSMKALIKREFLEHRGAFLYAPAILLSIIAIAVAFIVVAGSGELIKLDGEIIIDGEHIIVPSGETIYQIGLATTLDVHRVLRVGSIVGEIEAGQYPGEWKCKVVEYKTKARDIGVVTIVVKHSILRVSPVEWEDL
jgi:hypothetical protein